MPLVRIDLRAGSSLEYRRALGDGVHRAMIEALAIPADDRFQVIMEHPPEEGLVYDPGYLGVRRSDRVVFVQITCAGRKPQQKRKLYGRMAEILAESPGLEPKNC